jgi:Mn2+/Fe2+ NRAMP family transporter
VPYIFKRLRERSQTDLWLTGIVVLIPVAAIANYGPARGLWASGAILYVIAPFTAVPALVIRVCCGSRLSFGEWAAVFRVLAFVAFGFVTRGESLGFFTLLGVLTGGFFAMVVAYIAWRARSG